MVFHRGSKGGGLHTGRKGSSPAIAGAGGNKVKNGRGIAGAPLPSDPHTGLMGSADGTPAVKKRGRPGIEELAPRFEECMNKRGVGRGTPKTLSGESFGRLSTLFSSQFEAVFKCKPTRKAIAARGAEWVFEDITLHMDSGTENPLEAFLIISSGERASMFEAHMLRAGVTKNVAMTLGEGNEFRRFATNFKSAFVTAFGVEPTREWIRLTGAGWVFKQMTLRTCNGTAGSTTDPLEAFLKISGELRTRDLGAPRSSAPPPSRPSRVPAGKRVSRAPQEHLALKEGKVTDVSTNVPLRTFIHDRLGGDIDRSASAIPFPLEGSLKIHLFPKGTGLYVKKIHEPALVLICRLHNVLEGRSPPVKLGKQLQHIGRQVDKVGAGGGKIGQDIGMQLWALRLFYGHQSSSSSRRFGGLLNASIHDILTSPIAQSFFKGTRDHYLGSSG